jgi:hypothetical protein
MPSARQQQRNRRRDMRTFERLGETATAPTSLEPILVWSPLDVWLLFLLFRRVRSRLTSL